MSYLKIYSKSLIFMAMNLFLTGHPTNAERLIVGLGLGGSGWNYDSDTAQTFSVLSNYNSSRKRRDNHPRGNRQVSFVHGDGTRCPHNQGAGEVCQHLSGI